jgi:hypothetical protein
MKCVKHQIEFTEAICPSCKQDNLNEAIKKADQAKEPDKKETETSFSHIEKVIFEDDEEVTLRDGKKYKISPATFKQARFLMRNIVKINVDNMFLNFIPIIKDNDQGEVDLKTSPDEMLIENENIDILMEIMEIAFRKHNLSKDEIEEFVDLNIAREVINILIGLSGLKK